MKLAIFQMSNAPDPDTNPDRIEAALREAAANGADLFVAPELSIAGYARGDSLTDLAQPTDGAWVRRFEALAHELGISVVAGFPERDGDTCRISAMIVTPEGTQVYRKAFLYGDYEKDKFRAAGPSVTMAEIAGVKTGFLICYDVEFPETVRRLAQAGAELVVVPTALPKSDYGRHIAGRVIPVRAFESQVFVAYVNNADDDGTFEYQGMSSVVAPDGQALAMAEDHGEVLLYAEIDPPAYAQCKRDNPYVADLAELEAN